MADPTWDETTDVANRAPASQPGEDAPTWENTSDPEEKYGGVSGALKAFGLGAARTPTFGGSDVALTKSGLISPQDIKGYEEQNPVSSVLGSFAGVGAAMVAPEASIAGALSAPAKLAARFGGSIAESAAPAFEAIAGAVKNPAVSKVLAQAGAHALGSAAEAQFYNLGNAVSEDALGDPDAFGEKLVANAGTSALWGAGLGAVFGAFKGRPNASGKLASEAAENPSAPPPTAPGEPSNPISDAPKTGVQPTSLEDIEDRVAAAKKSGKAVDLPQKAILNDALSRVEMENPVHPLQMSSLDDQGSRDLYNITKETPGKTGDALRGYESIQKNELVDKIDQTISDSSPKEKPTSDAVDGGNRAIKAFTDQYQAEKEELTPAFKQLKATPIEGDALTGMVQKMTDAVPGIAKMIEASDEGLIVKPYDTSWGIDKATYRAVKEAIQALKKNPSDFESLANIRGALDQHVDILSQGKAPAQIRALKASMMDYIQDAVQKSTPDMEVRAAFKRWAINEQERGVIEKVFGASVGTPEFGAISKIKPEIIGDRIFANTASVTAAKNILSPESFNAIRANWLSEAKAAATDKGAFSSNKFASFLRKNQDALSVAFKDDPENLQRLGDLTTISRILPDAAPVNPSGTAKTIIGMIKNLIPHDITAEGLAAALPKKALEKIGQMRQMSEVRDALAGKSDKVDSLSLIERTAAKTDRAIKSGASQIFSSKILERIPAIAPQMRRDIHDNAHEKISDLMANPEKMIDQLSQKTEALSQAAPKTAAAVQGAMSRATQFLQSKLPGNGVHQSPLGPKYQPSDAELSKWHSYYRAIEDPTEVLHAVATGTIVPETMEALSTVYPKMLQEMRVAVTDKMSESVAKKNLIPYRTKMALSLFLGSDMVNSLNPVSMLANQNMLATATMQHNAQQSQMSGANKKSSGKMGKSNSVLTASQAAAQRQEV